MIQDRINGTDTQSGKTPPSTTDSPGADDGRYDIGLTLLNSTMVYSEVYNMVYTPDDYLGKKVKMHGYFAYGKGNDRYYFACQIPDATACCATGIEFVLKDERVFPDEYPDPGEEITVVGIFDTYYEGEYRYCQLIDAVLS